MKPASFSRLVPTSVPEALAMLGAHAPEACVLAGGQSLVPMMNFRLARPAVLVDLNRVSELACIRDEGDHLAIGAMTRERTIENSDLVRAASPLLHEATLFIGHLPIRSRGTIGGSIANADPAAEYPAVVLALDATLVAQSVRGERRIPADKFFDGVMSTALEPDEILTEIIVPKMPAGSGAAFVEIARRHGDFAIVSAAALLEAGPDGRITRASVTLGGIGSAPVRVTPAENALMGAPGSAETFGTAAEMCRAIDAHDDIHAPASYRQHLAVVLSRRALEAAWSRVDTN